MKKVLLVFTLMATATFVKSQVGIGTDNPKATLEVVGANTATSIDGIVIPRISRKKAIDMVGDINSTIVENSTLVYIDDITGYVNTDTGVASEVDVVGFYLYKKSASKWKKLPDYDQVKDLVSDNTYWKAQASTSSPKNGQTFNKSNNSTELVDVNIYQKGKVGIGYNKSADIDFGTKNTQKQLEVGGDLRAVYTDTDTITNVSRFYGMETNTNGLPNSLKGSGNVIFNAKTKNAGEFDDFTKDFDGTGIFQNHQFTFIGSRTGTSVDKNVQFATTLVSPLGITSSISNDLFATESYVSQGVTSFSVSNKALNSDVSFGINFPITLGGVIMGPTTHNFYIGNTSGNGYYFPNTKGTKDQILKLDDKGNLQWSNSSGGTSSSQFFYMPSIVINTSKNGTGLKRNLHAEYVAQFTGKEFVPDSTTGGALGTAVSTKFVKSTGAPVAIPNIPTANQLYYYITDYDESALKIIDIDENGIMTYDVIGTGTDYSFVNIVFVVK